jgi:elongation factor P
MHGTDKSIISTKKTMASPTNVRKGKVLNYQNTPHLVLDVQHRTQGRQAGFMQVTMRNLSSGASTNTKIRTTDSVEIMHTDMVKLEFSYVDGDGYHFMDPETFEDVILDEGLIEEAKDFLVETQAYSILHVDDKPISIDLPASLEMKVTESAEGVKGDTASNVQKPATLETGLTVQVPLFIKEGETIKVNTADRSYGGRA